MSQPDNEAVRDLLWTPPSASDHVSAVCLYLHGGAVRSHRAVTSTALTFQRARWVRDALAPSLANNGIASALLRYNVRGWNARDGEPSPLADARWGLEQVRSRYDVPIVLVGHSMGGRTGLRVADHPNVVGLVALAPWFPADENVDALRGRHLVVIHGTRDRITSPSESLEVARRSEAVTRSTRYLPLQGLGHYLLNGAASWHRATRDAVEHIASESLDQPTSTREA